VASDLLEGDLDNIRLEMDTNYHGILSVVRAFAPQIAANGGGAILNILSALSWYSFPDAGAYCAAKSAQWSLTNALRVQLADQGIRVAGLHVGYMDTDMTQAVTAPKSARRHRPPRRRRHRHRRLRDPRRRHQPPAPVRASRRRRRALPAVALRASRPGRRTRPR
jgi:NAD(P)-dependent dehydrogenase (short-subunit alcohol dehydrogenase family)